MDDTPVIQLVTLWFVVLIFLQTASADFGGPLEPVIAIPAIGLTYLIPLYLLAEAGAKLVDD